MFLLFRYRDYIVRGTHFINFAVQEPGGTMILKASYGGVAKDGASSGSIFHILNNVLNSFYWLLFYYLLLLTINIPRNWVTIFVQN